MQIQNNYYQEERVYAGTRLIILFILALSSFVISTDMVPKILLVRLVLGGQILLSMLHYAFIGYRPDTLVSLRKNVLIFLDLLTLTFLISIFEKYGLFLFPFYVLIVMQSSLYFGKKYIYTSIVSATVSWVLLSKYSPYWYAHYDIIIAFAITTFLVSLFSLRFIGGVEEYETYDKTDEEVTATKPNVKHKLLADIANRTMYKEVIQNTLKEKETFNLLFIGLDNFQVITDKYGSQVGDSVLEETAKRLKNSIDEDDFLARLGSNEFVIISKKQRVFLRKFLKKLEDNTIGACHIDGISTRIELNIGISLYPENGQTEMLLSKCADDAMHAAKENPNAHHMFYGGIKKNETSTTLYDRLHHAKS